MLGAGGAQVRDGRTLLLALLALLAVAGCTVHTDVSGTGASPSSATHLAVTVREIWFATAPDTAPDASTGWLKHTLSAPVTLDLAALTPGTLLALASQLSVPSGTYRQVHLELADSADTLTSAAQALGLLYNAQISLTDSAGNLTTAALESLVPGGGLTIPTSLALSGTLSVGAASSSTTSSSSSTATATLLIDLDAARDVLPYTYGTSTGYLLSPAASVLDVKLAGAITGTVDTSALASGFPALFASAETLSAGGTHHVIVARRAVAADGHFTLYPLPAPRSGTTSYDVVISGAGSATTIVRSVPVSAGPVSDAVSIQSSAIALAPASAVYADLSPQSALLPGGARVVFYQTVAASGELPYAIDGTAIDPVTRRLPGGAFALADGPLHVGTYANGSRIALAVAAPAEGNARFLIGTEGHLRSDALATLQTPVSGSESTPTLVFAPVPNLASGAGSGRIDVTVSAAAGRYDAGFLVVTSGNRLVESADLAALLAAGGGSLSLTVPAGSGLSGAAAGVPYQLALRAWNSRDAAGSLVRSAATAGLVLGAGAIAAASISVP
jgi:hypothetical protein